MKAHSFFTKENKMQGNRHSLTKSDGQRATLGFSFYLRKR